MTLTSQQQAVELDYLTRVLKDVDIDVVEPEFSSYINYAGKRIFHSCDDMKTDYEAGFCNGGLFFLTSARPDLGVQGYSYSCKRHLRKLAFQYALYLEEKSLDREYDAWEDSLCKECGQPQDSSLEPHDHEQTIESRCSICGCYDNAEHDWEAHTRWINREGPWEEPA